MPSEEGREVLRLLAEGKIDAEQAYRLLAALGDIPGEGEKAKQKERYKQRYQFGFGGPEGRGRLLRIRVTEGGKQKVNIAVPLALARLGRIGGIADHLVKRFDLDLHDILRTVQTSAGGKIVDVVDEEGGDRVEIFVE